MCTGPLLKFSFVKSHLLESWCANFSISLTSENLVCVHTGESRSSQARREKLVKENLPVCTGLENLSLLSIKSVYNTQYYRPSHPFFTFPLVCCQRPPDVYLLFMYLSRFSLGRVVLAYQQNTRLISKLSITRRRQPIRGRHPRAVNAEREEG